MNSSPTATRPATRFRFSTRALFRVTLLAAVVIALVFSAHRAINRQLGIGPIRSQDDWPHAFERLVGEDPSRAADVRLHGLGEFIDHKSIWLIDGDSPLIDELLERYAVESTSNAHPHAEELLSSIPHSWPDPATEASWSWHTSPNYGTQHMEGIDLFLILYDRANHRAYVLHEWIF